jgi:hypothetical protein
LLRRNLTTGEERVVYSADPGEAFGHVSLSPDEAMIAFWHSESEEAVAKGIFVIPANPDRPLTKRDVRFFPAVLMFDWGPSGKGLFVRRLATSENRRILQTLYYPALDPNMSPIPLQLQTWQADFAFHPDGETVAFTQRTNRGEFWILENILPKERP